MITFKQFIAELNVVDIREIVIMLNTDLRAKKSKYGATWDDDKEQFALTIRKGNRGKIVKHIGSTEKEAVAAVNKLKEDINENVTGPHPFRSGSGRGISHKLSQWKLERYESSVYGTGMKLTVDKQEMWLGADQGVSIANAIKNLVSKYGK